MKFSLFVHMGQTQPAKTATEDFRNLVELVQSAEAGGFEKVWIGEHLGMGFTVSPNPFQLMAYLAARTERIRFGVGTIVAPFWHPIRLAGEAALADVISDGRIELGLARGAYQFEFDRMTPGLKASEGGKYLRELVPALQGLYAGDYAHDGDCWSFPATTVAPKPIQQPHPPLWIAARDPASHDFAVAQGCNLMVTPLWNPDSEVEDLMSKFNTAVADHPEVSRPQVMLLRHTYVHEQADDWRMGANALSRFYSYFEEWFKGQRPVSNGFVQPLSADEIAAKAHFAPEVLRENLVIGQPETVIERLRAYERMGYDEYAFWIDADMPQSEKRRSLALFIDEVMPAFTEAHDAPIAGRGRL